MRRAELKGALLSPVPLVLQLMLVVVCLLLNILSVSCIIVKVNIDSFHGRMPFERMIESFVPSVLNKVTNLIPFSRLLATADNGFVKAIESCALCEVSNVNKILEYIISEAPEVARYILPQTCFERLMEIGYPWETLYDHYLLPAIPSVLERQNMKWFFLVMERIDKFDPDGAYRFNSMFLTPELLEEYEPSFLRTPMHRYITSSMIPRLWNTDEDAISFLRCYANSSNNVTSIAGSLVILVDKRKDMLRLEFELKNLSVVEGENPNSKEENLSIKEENLPIKEKDHCIIELEDPDIGLYDNLIQELQDRLTSFGNKEDLQIAGGIEMLKLKLLLLPDTPGSYLPFTEEIRDYLRDSSYFDFLGLLEIIVVNQGGAECREIAGTHRLRLLERRIPRQLTLLTTCLTTDEHIEYFRKRIGRPAQKALFKLGRRSMFDVGETLSVLMDSFIERPVKIHYRRGYKFLRDSLSRYLAYDVSPFIVDEKKKLLSFRDSVTFNISEIAHRVMIIVLLLKLHSSTPYDLDAEIIQQLACSHLNTTLRSMVRLAYNIKECSY